MPDGINETFSAGIQPASGPTRRRERRDVRGT